MKPAEVTFQRARWWGTHTHTWSPLKRKLTRFNNKWWERCHTGHSNKITAGCWYRSDGWFHIFFLQKDRETDSVKLKDIKHT